jgi:UDP-N-acetylmuramoyl-tripeptide--D-alanyl-D-alanine ligase
VDTRDLNFVLSACAGKLVRGSKEVAINRVCTDSRQARAGDLFVAIPGERHDAHTFLPDVMRQGVRAMMVEQARVIAELPDCSVVSVENTRRALAQLAAKYRQSFALPVIAVGGSNGKTTTKELIASVLRQKLATLWSEASFNNDIGVPLTLLRLESSHQAAVLEVGTNHPGELEQLVRWVQPKLGVITNVAREHLEFFGDLAGVAKEEGALAQLLPADGTLFINGDNEWTPEIVKRANAKVVRVGLNDGNEWRGTNIRLDKAGAAFRVECARDDIEGEFRIQLLGKHQVTNALFAVALGAELGLNREEIQRGLAQCEPPKMRLQVWELNGVRVLDDAYNANTDSVLAALETLHDLPCRGRRVAVLGDMAELGQHTESAHLEVGRRAAEFGVEQLFAIGRMASVMARAAREAGLNRVLEFQDVEPAAAAVKQFLKPGDVLLLKASRSSRLERIAELLRGEGRKI